MSINLYKVSSVLWIVTHERMLEPRCFSKPEEACEYLEHVGVDGDELDFAIMDMYAKDNYRANFGLDGRFIFSDRETIEMGSA